MPDREKVIKDIEECLSASCRGFRPRLSCPYNDDEWDIMSDALALLKERDIDVKEASKNINNQDPIVALMAAIVCTNLHDEYSVGFRNGIRYAISLLTGKEPKYEDVT